MGVDLARRGRFINRQCFYSFIKKTGALDVAVVVG
jgi:hypothetical protein